MSNGDYFGVAAVYLAIGYGVGALADPIDQPPRSVATILRHYVPRALAWPAYLAHWLYKFTRYRE